MKAFYQKLRHLQKIKECPYKNKSPVYKMYFLATGEFFCVTCVTLFLLVFYLGNSITYSIKIKVFCDPCVSLFSLKFIYFLFLSYDSILIKIRICQELNKYLRKISELYLCRNYREKNSKQIKSERKMR